MKSKSGSCNGVQCKQCHIRLKEDMPVGLGRTTICLYNYFAIGLNYSKSMKEIIKEYLNYSDYIQEEIDV